MERIIRELQKDLRNIIEDKKPRALRKKSGDLVDLRALRIIDFSLQWASVGYKSALRFAGMKFGRRLGEMSSSRELSSILKEIKKIVEGLKEGEAKFQIMEKESMAQFKVYNSSLTNSVPNISQNLCLFREGFIEGYLGGIIAVRGSLLVFFKNVNRIEVEETKCQGKGDKFCQFTIVFK